MFKVKEANKNALLYRPNKFNKSQEVLDYVYDLIEFKSIHGFFDCVIEFNPYLHQIVNSEFTYKDVYDLLYSNFFNDLKNNLEMNGFTVIYTNENEIINYNNDEKPVPVFIIKW